MPLGKLNLATLPTPSALPEENAAPANVVTTPPGMILRIVLLLESATYSVPVVSTVIPEGLANRAALPVPSTWPELPATPASVLTTPAGVIVRIVLLLESATYTVPA